MDSRGQGIRGMACLCLLVCRASAGKTYVVGDLVLEELKIASSYLNF